MFLLRKIHLYMGLTLGLLFLLTAISGTILLYRAEIIVAFMDQTPVYQKLTSEQEVAALKTLPNVQVSFIDFPTISTPWFRVWHYDGNVFYYHPTKLTEIYVHFSMTEKMMWLADLHIHFLGGEVGELILGYVGLFLIFMIVSGIYLWWPGRNGFKIKHIIFINLSRGALINSHRTLGVISSGILFIITLSGVGLIFYGTSQKIVSTITGEELTTSVIETTKSIRLKETQILDLNDLINEFHMHVPDGELARYYSPVSREVTSFRLRYKYPEDWAPFGASFMTVNFLKGGISNFKDYRLDPTYNHITRKFYPIHAGKMGNKYYTSILALSSIAFIIIIVSGILAWYKKFN